jgi:hypothetical protein
MVVTIPPEEIAVASAKGDKPDQQSSKQLYFKEKNQPYGKIKKQP